MFLCWAKISAALERHTEGTSFLVDKCCRVLGWVPEMERGRESGGERERMERGRRREHTQERTGDL